MALIFCDSFDHYATADILLKWSTGSGVITSTGARNVNCLELNVDAVTKTFPANYSTGTVGFAFRTNIYNTTAFFRFADSGTIHLDLRLTAAGGLQITRNGTLLEQTAAAEISLNTWYFIEFQATIGDSGTGYYELRINGVTKLNNSGATADTRNGGNASFNQIVLNAASIDNLFDDLYLLDNTSPNNTFLGDVKIKAVLPDGAGNYTQWTPSTGSNYQNVDDTAPDEDSTYNYSSTAGQKDTYTFGAVGITGTVKAIQICAEVRKDDAGSRSVRILTRESSTDHNGTTVSCTDNFGYVREVQDTIPGGAAWSVSTVDAAEFGIELVS